MTLLGTQAVCLEEYSGKRSITSIRVWGWCLMLKLQFGTFVSPHGDCVERGRISCKWIIYMNKRQVEKRSTELQESTVLL